MRSVLVIFSVILLVAGLSGAKAFDEKEGADYHSSNRVMAEVDAVLKAARAEGKFALFALGANWCHDSRGLAHKLKTPEVKAVVDANYVPLLVSVGYYDSGLEVARRFGRPTIFSTPTVLIIDPETGAQVNADTMHRWSRSAAMTVPEMASNLQSVAMLHQTGTSHALSPAQQAAYSRIKAFEDQVGARISKGFTVVGPILKAHREGEAVDLDAVWDPLAILRYRLMNDVTEMRRKVKEHKGEEPISLSFPTYDPLPWEVED